jgi:hypothetical protein
MDFDIDKESKIVVDNAKYSLEEETLKLMALAFAVSRLLNDAGFPALVSEINPDLMRQLR